jgi:hypothetical protein
MCSVIPPENMATRFQCKQGEHAEANQMVVCLWYMPDWEGLSQKDQEFFIGFSHDNPEVL